MRLPPRLFLLGGGTGPCVAGSPFGGNGGRGETGNLGGVGEAASGSKTYHKYHKRRSIFLKSLLTRDSIPSLSEISKNIQLI